MRARSMCSVVVAVSFGLPLPRAASAEAQLPPTPTGNRTTPGSPSDGHGLNVPDRWSTSEDGMLIPHPVTMNGRVLMDVAIPYYARWKGLRDPGGALEALSRYLLLATLSQNPAALESKPSTYALRFLPEAERGEYACNPKDELEKRSRNEANAYGACHSGRENVTQGAG